MLSLRRRWCTHLAPFLSLLLLSTLLPVICSLDPTDSAVQHSDSEQDQPSPVAKDESDTSNNDNQMNLPDASAALLELLNQTEIIDDGVIVEAEDLSNEPEPAAESSTNETTAQLNESKSKQKLQLNCTPVFRDSTNWTSQLVLVNVSTLSHYLQLKATPSLEIAAPAASPPVNQTTSNEPGECTVLIFYLDWCPFSAKAAAHFNALGRLYPQLNILAIDAYTVYSTTMRYGVVGVPSVYVFHENKLVSRYNNSEVTIDKLALYLKRITTFNAVGELNITEADLLGPLSSEVAYTFNYTFAASWLFCIVVGLYYFSRSELFRRAKEHVYNMWNEAQFQHEHVD